MNKIPDLSVIIVSSKKDFLLDCLGTLEPALAGIENEIILIDNASIENIGSLAKEKYPEIKVIRREENGGFGENNNMGMRIAKGRFVLLLNDDTKLLDKNIFKEMVAWMDAHPKVGISSCALVNPDGITYQGSGGYYPTLFRVFAWMTFLDDIPGVDRVIGPYHPLHSWSPFYKGGSYFKNKHRQDWVTGAFFLMRAEAMKEAGIFDEDFFLYVEEVELATRFIKKGWQIWYLPEWKIIHYGQVTTGSEKAMIFELQNLILMYKKHEKGWKIPILRGILKLGTVLRMILWGVVGKREVFKVYAKAFKAI
ncbi:MAG: Glycosyl transferase family 2 [Candidatus Woesebacteria bacterium GW2011_GWA1_41_7]|uniref:Glycosyl transferase family 2 n=1 Tax=Candidatus Woesebacteria bacterium GW2011_GWA1_41_7 TaxID=1618556 RepID=A0A0G0ZW56_9BACT|nr:MAG: Glycosyl transferase family 2 [Candidatus Woesebacteria bacterium GW2011_GWA1_41_7]